MVSADYYYTKVIQGHSKKIPGNLLCNTHACVHFLLIIFTNWCPLYPYAIVQNHCDLELTGRNRVLATQTPSPTSSKGPFAVMRANRQDYVGNVDRIIDVRLARPCGMSACTLFRNQYIKNSHAGYKILMRECL